MKIGDRKMRRIRMTARSSALAIFLSSIFLSLSVSFPECWSSLLVGRTRRKLFFACLLFATLSAAHADKVADPHFTFDRGFYDTNLSVEITCATPGASIRYTTNCFEPDGGNSFLYAGPV